MIGGSDGNVTAVSGTATSSPSCNATGGVVGTTTVTLAGNCVTSIVFTPLVPGVWIKDTHV